MLLMSCFKVWGIFSIGLAATWAASDPCQTTHILDNPDIRSVYHVVPKDIKYTQYLWDKIISGWYKFQEGEISTKCVPAGHCTRSPIWMDDTIPTVAEGIQRKKFCVRFTIDEQTPSQCCTWSIIVEVKNCSSYLVYNLKTGDSNISPTAYCTDNIIGTVTTTPTPTVHNIAKTTRPRLIGPTVTNSSFTFECIFNKSQSLGNSVSYNVTWEFNHVAVDFEIISGDDDSPLSAVSNESMWFNHIGEKLSCSVTPLTVNGGNMTGRSNHYWGGIQVKPGNITVAEGEDVSLKVTSTLPILCSSDTDNCTLRLDVLVDNKPHPDDLIMGRCQVELHSSSTGPSDDIILNITVPVHPAIVKQKMHTLTLSYVDDGETHPMWSGYTASVKVTTEDGPHNNCIMFGNGNIVGFRKFKVHTMEYPGDYLMYRAPKDAPAAIVVQTRHRAVQSQPSDHSKGGTSAICAVALQYGPEVVTFDLCEQPVPLPVITAHKFDNDYIKLHRCDADDYSISARGDVDLEIKVRNDNLDINLHLPYMYSALQSRSNTSDGLCTESLADKLFTLGNLRPYILDRKSSFFRDGVTNLQDIHVTDGADYCRCGSSSNCDTKVKYSDHTRDMHNCSLIKPRLGTNTGKDSPPGSAYRFYPRNNTGGGLVSVDALNRCRTALLDHTPKFCHNQLTHAQNTFFRSCQDDFSYTNSSDSIVSNLQGYVWLCRQLYLANIAMYATVNGVHIPPPEVTSDLCPAFCKLNGVCRHGTCSCKSSFVGKDCSYLKDAIPHLIGIEGGPECTNDITGRCYNPVLITSNLVDNSALHVEVAPIIFEYGQGKELSNKSQLLLPITFLTKYSVQINLTLFRPLLSGESAFGFKIFLIKTGHPSEYATYVVYDSVCRKCFANGPFCTLKEGACHIHKKCYKMGEVKPSDPTRVCDPKKSLLHWTKKTGTLVSA